MATHKVLSALRTSTTNASFDPFDQTFTLLMPDGTTPFLVYLAEVDELYDSGIHQAIIQAIQLGLAAMLLVIMLLMTKSEKRRSVVFIVNAVALSLVVLRSGLLLGVLTGPYYSFYRWASHSYFGLGNAPSIASAGEVISFLLTLAIELALVLQVRIVCCTLPTLPRLAVNGVNIFVAAVACACYFSLCVMNIRWDVLGVQYETFGEFDTINSMAKAAYIAITISIGLSSLIFITKLAIAIRKRRSIGMTQFGPMQIIFVMGCQTMFIPFIFTVVSYFGVPHAQLDTFVQTSVAVLLPLSGMWAATNTNNVNIARPEPRGFRAVPFGYSAADSKTAHSSGGDDAGGTIADDDDRDEAASAKKSPSYDLELQGLSGGVVVDRTYSVSCG